MHNTHCLSTFAHILRHIFSAFRLYSLLSTFFFVLGFLYLCTSRPEKWRCACSIPSKKAEVAGSEERYIFSDNPSWFQQHVDAQSVKRSKRNEKYAKSRHFKSRHYPTSKWLQQPGTGLTTGENHDSCGHLMTMWSKGVGCVPFSQAKPWIVWPKIPNSLPFVLSLVLLSFQF